MNIYIAGHKGMVGSSTYDLLSNLDEHQILVKTREELDLVNQNAVNSFFDDNDIDVVVLDEHSRKRLQVSSGVVVDSVGEGAAQEAGIRPDDVISSINNQTIKTVKDFNSVLKSLPSGKAIPLLIVRQGNPSFVVIKLND